jgi:beta-phosphoglucomutase
MKTEPETLKAIIFDVDGVLFDTEPLHIRAWQLVLADFGVHVEDRGMRRWVGKPCVETAAYYAGLLEGTQAPLEGEKIIPKAGRDVGENRLTEVLFSRKEEELKTIVPVQLTVMPGIERYLRNFSRLLPLAYATTTGREMLDLFFSVSGIGPHFSTGVTSNDVRETKPSPEPYLEVLRRLDVEAAEAVVLEDSPSGIGSAKAAGIYCLGIAGSLGPAALSQADKIFPRTADACAWIRDTCRVKPETAGPPRR